MKRKNIVDIIFLLTLSMILLGGFINPIINSTDINYIENRTANKLPILTTETFSNNQFQNNLELALADQIPLAHYMKLANKTLFLLTKINYFNFNNNSINLEQGLYLMNDYLTYYPKDIESNKKNIELKIKNYNNLANKYKNIDFYLYYIEKDTDINFQNNNKLGIYEQIKQLLNSNINSSKFNINNFDEFKKYFYKTDHHWNYQGSYNAYKEILALLEINDNPIEPLYFKCLGYWSGSKARSLGGQLLFKENFCVYNFDFSKHDIYINNSQIDYDYSYNLENYANEISYAGFYGADSGLIKYDYYNEDRDNLLIIGESYDNAINELLASHFNKTYNVDLRNYENDIGEKFNFDEFVIVNEIDKVLFIGNIDFYIMDTFLI